MRALIIFAIIVVLNSCRPNSNAINRGCINTTGINDSLYNILLEYQRKNVIPVIKTSSNNLPPLPETAFKYIYEVHFKIDQDTMAIISLKPDGINLYKNGLRESIYGVYADSCLRPTYILCDSSLCKDILSIHKKERINDFHYDNSSIIDIIYVQYVYKLSGSSLIFQNKIQGNIGK